MPAVLTGIGIGLEILNLIDILALTLEGKPEVKARLQKGSDTIRNAISENRDIRDEEQKELDDETEALMERVRRA